MRSWRLSGGTEVSVETVLQDTSYLSQVIRVDAGRPMPASWTQDVRERIANAVGAITPFTIGEIVAGGLEASWGRRKLDEMRRRLDAFLLVPLDTEIVEEWARVRVAARGAGVGVTDNDLWIAASASAKRIPLITADQDQRRLEPFLSCEVVWLPNGT